MAAYRVQFDFSAMSDKLADIERGNPQRNLYRSTLHGAVSTANIVRMALGMGMMRGPRSLGHGASYNLSGQDVDIRLTRVE